MHKIIYYYLLILIVHALHILEEISGNAYFIESFYGGLSIFSLVMLILFLIPVIIFYFLIKNKKFSYYLAIAYSVIIILDGFSHIIEPLVMDKSLVFAGTYTGIIFIPLGILLIYEARKQIKHLS